MTTEIEDRDPCLDDLIESLQATRANSGNIVVVLRADDVQCPGEFYALEEFFAFWEAP